ncbi:hypothetical protein LAZ67_21001210 [Cordylochernes scorpioides]|uniref:Mos1 transposase HTH domain-containing protein n=1 Tax=Cordylochernes scorpioides TaxID=51811 RepID=A0ABY6LQN4_9ARAC|nr:hypothetical protein LAZ67_21001210 [Cordylochernes scorpioides]
MSSFEQRTNIKFCVKLKGSFTETLPLMIEAYEDEKLSRKQDYFWYKRFKDGCKGIADDSRSGRPLASTTYRNIGQVRVLIVADRKITIDNISEIQWFSLLHSDESKPVRNDPIEGIVKELRDRRCHGANRENGFTRLAYMTLGQTIYSIVYSELLEKNLKPNIRSKRRWFLNKGVCLQHDNARLHFANLTIETIN